MTLSPQGHPTPRTQRRSQSESTSRGGPLGASLVPRRGVSSIFVDCGTIRCRLEACGYDHICFELVGVFDTSPFAIVDRRECSGSCVSITLIGIFCTKIEGYACFGVCKESISFYLFILGQADVTGSNRC